MTTKSWIIWIVAIALIAGGGFGLYWYLTQAQVGADVETASTSSTVTTGTGSSMATGNTEMTIKKGWSFVSFPYNTVTTVSALETKLGTIEMDALYSYTGSSWTNALDDGVIKPGAGYIAYFDSAGTIDLGDTGTTNYSKDEYSVTAGQWNLVGVPLLAKIQFRGSGSSATSYVPNSGLSLKMADGSTVTMLDAIAKGYVETPLFMENSDPSYSYVYIYDLVGNFVPSFSAFWLKPISTDVEAVMFNASGTDSKSSISKESLESVSNSTYSSTSS